VLGASARALARQAEVLVDNELADTGIAGEDDGEANDGSEREQLRRNILELAKTLGDGVASLVLLGNRSHQTRGLAEHPESSGGAHFG
jgi:hypothetical protein